MMKRINQLAKSTPLLFGLLTILSYGLLIPWLGYYWDDWVFVFLSHFYGPAELVQAFARNRPFLGPIFYVTTLLLGDNPIVWQAFGLLIRFILSYVTWCTLSMIWPKYRRQILITVCFFLVYPGYSQQWVAFTHINQELISLTAYIGSIGICAYSLRNPSKYTRSTIFALVLMFVGLFSTEYFIGYEALRLLVIYYLSREENVFKRIKFTLKHWLSYAIMLLAYGGWQLYFRLSGIYQSYDIQVVDRLGKGSINLAWELAKEALHTLTTVGLSAWWQTVNPILRPADTTSLWMAAGLLGLSFLLVSLFLNKANDEADGGTSDTWAVQALVLGIVAILAGRMPSWVAGLPVSVRYEFDRFNLSMMLGACLALAGLLELFIRGGKRKILIVGLIVALGVQYQNFNAVSFRQDWEQQKKFLSELSWRIPGMEPGTILLTNQIDAIPYESDMGLSAALNWVYAPDLASHDLPYVFLFTRTRLGEAKLPGLQPDQSISFDYRTAHFQGSTSHTILFNYPVTGCLKVIGANTDESSLSGFPEELEAAIFLSDLGRISSEGASATLPGVIFGKDLAHTWCYYYEKAELARQIQAWAQITKLGDEAQSLGFTPIDPLEWIPFIEGYLRSGDLEAAQRITGNLLNASPGNGTELCKFFTRVQAQTDKQSVTDFASTYLVYLGCEL